ncbi:hypothetical protein IJ098_01285 [Candidatus Saccharibacteria bacterium]|nr:hypothetical protein [Candidatus Saccharibacteria bacterium]
MSEKLNNNPENVQEASSNSGWENLSEVPFKGNSNQVENIDKARAMAEASNENMTVAARANNVAENATSDFQKHYAERHAEIQQGFADAKAERAAKEFDATQNTETPDTSELVEDIDKARVMAEAANENMTVATKANEVAKNATSEFQKHYAEKTAEMQRGFANTKAEQAAKEYDANN